MNGARVVGLVLAAIMISSTLAGCAAGGAQAGVAQAAVPREAKPQVAAAEVPALVAGNSAFAFDLYRALRGQEGNLLYSPYSVSLALAATYAGARGQTEAQMAKTLRFPLPQERLHPAYNALDLELAGRGSGAKGQDGKGFRLRIANSVWGQTGYQFLPQYLDTLAKNYGAGLRLTDFANAPEPARVAINDWVKEQTEGKIVDLLPQGTIKNLTRLVLANAVYFNAAWREPFQVAATKPGPFHLLDGKQVSVPLMNQSQSLRYVLGQGYQAVALPYDGGEVEMLVLVPDAGAFPAFEGALSGERLAEIVKSLQPRQVELSLPKFNLKSEFGLGDTLASLGMPDALNPAQADFSGMNGKRDLYVQAVVHKAVVTVDERGTEAAAATGVVVGVTSAPANPVTLTVDRPFVFLIRDVKTGTVLFLGRVLNPVA